MCGLFGGLGVERVADAVFEQMAQRLAHRGPDGVAVARRGAAVLGLTRLAIVGAQEPARVFTFGPYAAVMNGELYNHAALRRSLKPFLAAQRQSAGEGTGLTLAAEQGRALRVGASRTRGAGSQRARTRRLTGASDASTLASPTRREELEPLGLADTAVLPALFARDAEDFVHALEGPFAIALHDAARGQLHLIRDRLGKKPLYVATLGSRVFFASEQKALTHLPGFRARLNAQSVERFLRRGDLEDEQLLFEDLTCVQPGEWVTVHADGALTRRTWWSLPSGRALAQPLERIGAALHRAVQQRLPDEVPWALLLSGGLDSTLIGAAAGPRLTRALCMESPGEGDARRARAAAKALGVKLEVVPLPTPDLESFERALLHLEQPDAFAAWAMAPAVLHLGAAVRAGGARVALMGEGADELFLGYAWDLLQAAVERGDGKLPADAVRLLGPRAAHFGLRQSIARIVTPQPRAREVWLDTALGSAGAPSPESEALGPGARGRQRTGLRRDMLTLPVLHADRLLMASGVEARMPFLDHHLVGLALRLAPVQLERAGVDKPLLRELAARWVPRWKAPPKRGFSAPASPPLPLLHSLRARLARGGAVAVEAAYFRGARGWTDAVRAHALWRRVVLELSARQAVGSA
jgi:asparagine synthase (glutamine-hydrolysing)